jgi:hypothetical protein
MTVGLSVCLSLYPSVCMSVRLSIYPFVYQSVFLYYVALRPLRTRPFAFRVCTLNYRRRTQTSKDLFKGFQSPADQILEGPNISKLRVTERELEQTLVYSSLRLFPPMHQASLLNGALYGRQLQPRAVCRHTCLSSHAARFNCCSNHCLTWL